MSKEDQLRPLIDAVMSEDLAPIEAEMLIYGLELDGQKWPASFSDPQWPLAFAALWIAWRNQERLTEQWDRFRFWSGHVWRDPMSEDQTCELVDAEADLWRALVDGSVLAKGLPDQEPDYVDISPIHWLNLVWMPGWGKMSVRNLGGPEPRYRVVLVDRGDVLGQWPQEGSADTNLPKPEEHNLSGAPGRPTSMHLVEQEMVRRATAGEKEKNMLAEAKALASWLEATHPAMPKLGFKSIQNKLGSKFIRSQN